MATTLRYSAADWCFLKDAEPAAYYASLAEAGVEAVEMAAPENRSAVRAAELVVLNTIAPGMEVGLNRREHHAELIPQIRAVVQQAGDEGIAQVVIFSGNRDGQPDAEGIDACEEAIAQFLPTAEAAGVTLLFEVLNAVEHVDYQADNSAYAFELIRRFDSPNLRVLYDIFHMQKMGEDAATVVPANIDAIGHLHVAETPGRGIPLSSGNTDYAPIIRAAQAAGYDGWWGLEWVPQGESLAEIRSVIDLFESAAKE